MEYVAILGVLLALAGAGTVFIGWRDGWLWPSQLQVAGAAAGSSRLGSYNYVGIAGIVKFDAVRRHIGYQDANCIVRILAERIAADERCRLGRVGRTSIEFLYRAQDDAEALAVMRGLREALERPVTIDRLEFIPTIAIGSNRVPLRQHASELFDISACAVEEAGKHPERIHFVDPDHHGESFCQSPHMLIDLTHAVRGDALELHYMPKLRLADGAIIGAEALSRWTHPRHGVVAPAVFVGLAEETGLIRELTLWSLDRAIADQKRLLEAGLVLPIDVNLSGLLVSDADFCELIRERLKGAAGKIGLEITETAAIEDPAAGLVNLRRLADAGVHIAIDDFGAGLSSLSYLRDLPAHELKIDQTFIRSLTTSNRDPLLVRSAIEIARALEMEVTAEGVEDELALSLLSVMRCDNVQGFHVSQPLPLDQLIAYLRSDAARDSDELQQLRKRFGVA